MVTREGRRAGLAAVAALALAWPSGAAADEGRTGRLVVGLRAGADAARVLADAGVREAGPRIEALRALTVVPQAPLDRLSALERLRRDERVRWAAHEGRHSLRRALPDDPALLTPEPHGDAPQDASLQWPLARHGFTRAWSVTRGAGALVAVLDTGVDGEHPDLRGKIDDALDVGGGDPLSDEDGHGTHVASLACAATDNGIGMAGAGHDCRLLILKTDLTDASVARGIVAAADRGAHALNMSFGDDGREPSPLLADALVYAATRGVVLVAAAADEPVEEQGEPANLLQPEGTGPDLAAGLGLSVTAATAAGRRARFAGRGSQISLAAYGALGGDGAPRGLFGLYPGAPTPREQPTVVPPRPACGCRATLDGDDRYAFLPGTSMAAPHVAAAAALMRALNPELAAAEAVRLLKDTATRRAGRWTPDLGWGILDAGAAIDAARRVDRTAPVSRTLLPRTAGRRSVELRWSGRDVALDGLLPSGVRRYELWARVGDRAPRRVATSTGTRRRVRLRAGVRYAFHTIAVDAAGNVEPAPGRPDVIVRAGRDGVAATRPR